MRKGLVFLFAALLVVGLPLSQHWRGRRCIISRIGRALLGIMLYYGILR